MMRALFLAAALAAGAEAVAIKWTGIVNDQQWTTANNWYPAQVPGAGDAVTIDEADGKDATVVLTTPTKIASLNMGDLVATKAKLRLLAALQVAQSVSVSYNGEIEINSGAAALAAPSGDVKGTLSFLSGTLQGKYAVSGMANFGSASAQGAKIFNYAAVTHTGKKAMNAGGSWQFGNGSTVSTTADVDASGSNFQLIVADKSTGNSFTSAGLNWTQS
eukprot:TRINITY_DN2051_c0_g1_i1.p1 TRINITY_DN2051_c0_g1~~TRINITY_DN2051_c0_g1_i1.p1  ORF type:complete len:249 (+),score=128.95 TRINITY_DN2051_c0_g1_i1:94-747(+)